MTFQFLRSSLKHSMTILKEQVNEWINERLNECTQAAFQFLHGSLKHSAEEGIVMRQGQIPIVRDRQRKWGWNPDLQIAQADD